MKDLPTFLTIPAALIWIATRNVEACQEAFEAIETFQRHASRPEDGKVAVGVPIHNLGLTAVACIIAECLHPGDCIIRDKWRTYELLDNGRVRPKGKKRDTPAIDYEYRDAERELLRALRVENITAYTIGSDNVRHESDAALWLEREFKDEVGEDGHYHVMATESCKDPLRDIRFRTDEILREWPPKGGRKTGPKTGRPTHKDTWCSLALEMLDNGDVLPKRGATAKIAKLIQENGYGHYEFGTIEDNIRNTVNDWKGEHKDTA